MLLWAVPVYTGQSEISGYMIELSEGEESEDWTPVNEEPITDPHFKVCVCYLLYYLRGIML